MSFRTKVQDIAGAKAAEVTNTRNQELMQFVQDAAPAKVGSVTAVSANTIANPLPGNGNADVSFSTKNQSVTGALLRDDWVQVGQAVMVIGKRVFT